MIRARHNPFRVERILAIRYRPYGWSWDDLFARLEQLQFRAAIVGHKGSGKTTLLEDLAHRLETMGRRPRLLVLRGDDRLRASHLARELVARASSYEILLVDGAEQLSATAWRRLERRSRSHSGLIITAHAPGRLPTLLECRTNLPLLEEIVAELAPAELEGLRPLLAPLYDEHRGNIRDCLSALYDRISG